MVKKAGAYIAEYLAYMRGRNLSKTYIETDRAILGVFARYWGGEDIRELGKTGLYGFSAWLRDRTTMYGKPFKPRTVERYAKTAKLYVEWLYKRGLLLANPAEGFELPRPKQDECRNIPSQGEMAMILDNIESQRERALFELMYASGLRIQEALTLELSDLNIEERIARIRQGKGKKDRFVPFCQLARMHLIRYINDERKEHVRGLTEEARQYLFAYPGGKYPGGRLSRKMADARWKDALARVGLADKGYTLHGIRHACATHLLENGSSVRYVQELLGHACLTTTQVYVRPNRERIKAVYRTFHPRENERYEEVTEEYREELQKLKREVQKNREAKEAYRERAKLAKTQET
jgi:site-specific recombinase XerD